MGSGEDGPKEKSARNELKYNANYTVDMKLKF